MYMQEKTPWDHMFNTQDFNDTTAKSSLVGVGTNIDSITGYGSRKNGLM